jgi:hypothetical protein
LQSPEGVEALRLRIRAQREYEASRGHGNYNRNDLDLIAAAVSAPFHIGAAAIGLFPWSGGARKRIPKRKQKGGSTLGLLALVVVAAIIAGIIHLIEVTRGEIKVGDLIVLHRLLFVEGSNINTVLDRINFFNLSQKQKEFLLETGNAGKFDTMYQQEFVRYLHTFLLKGIDEEALAQAIEGGPPASAPESADATPALPVLPTPPTAANDFTDVTDVAESNAAALRRALNAARQREMLDAELYREIGAEEVASAAGTGLPALPGTVNERSRGGAYKTRRRKRKSKSS